MTKKLFITVCTGQVGTDGHYFVEVPNAMPENEIEDLIWELALDNAEMYGIYPPSDFCSELSEGDEDGDYEEEVEGDDNIGGQWEVYAAEKHDMFTSRGIPDWVQY